MVTNIPAQHSFAFPIETRNHVLLLSLKISIIGVYGASLLTCGGRPALLATPYHTCMQLRQIFKDK